METRELIILLAGVVIALNIGVSVFIVKQSEFEKTQKLLQVSIVWLIPIIGAISIWLVLRGLTSKPKEINREFGGGPQDSGYTE